MNNLYNKYFHLIKSNIIYDSKKNIYYDFDIIKIIYLALIYGNFISYCDKNISIHNRLNNVSEYDLHTILLEFEMINRMNFKYHYYLIFSLFSNLIILIYYYIYVM